MNGLQKEILSKIDSAKINSKIIVRSPYIPLNDFRLFSDLNENRRSYYFWALFAYQLKGIDFLLREPLTVCAGYDWHACHHDGIVADASAHSQFVVSDSFSLHTWKYWSDYYTHLQVSNSQVSKLNGI